MNNVVLLICGIAVTIIVVSGWLFAFAYEKKPIKPKPLEIDVDLGATDTPGVKKQTWILS